jgi:hypothetical protein
VVTIAVIGINRASYTIGYEGERAFRTDGIKHKHPAQEAEAAERHIMERIVARQVFDAPIILRYRATNEDPFPFEWAEQKATADLYRASLIRVSSLFEERFSG